MTTTEIRSLDELLRLVGPPQPHVRDKVRPALLPVDRLWLAATPLCVMATANAAGQCDASPKGDPPGSLVHVLDDRTIAVAERPGNRRVDGYRNLLENPHVGFTFVIPGRADTLRVNGRARLFSDAPWFDDVVVRGVRPVLAVVVDIEEVFFHCGRALTRGRVWHPESWQPEAIVPRRAVIAQAMERPELSIAELDEYYGPSYDSRLY